MGRKRAETQLRESFSVMIMFAMQNTCVYIMVNVFREFKMAKTKTLITIKLLVYTSC